MTRSRCSTRRSVVSVALAAGSACAAIMLAPGEARADNRGSFDLGIDGDANALLAPSPAANNLSTMGGGFKLRFGDHFRLRNGLYLTPEVGYAFDHVFGASTTNYGGTGEAENMNRFFAGLRVGFGRDIIPTLYAHAGYGFRTVSSSGLTNAQSIPGQSGLALDTGIAVEFRIYRHLYIGPHVEFTYIDTSTASPQWLTFGGHVDFVF
jgi:hypothetical protein